MRRSILHREMMRRNSMKNSFRNYRKFLHAIDKGYKVAQRDIRRLIATGELPF